MLYEIKNISSDLSSNKIDDKIIPNKVKVLSKIGKLETFASKLFGLELHANKNCISCGICWNNGPSNNIKNIKNKPKFGLNCSMCMRCIYKCPKKAINPYFSKFIPIEGGYNSLEYKI